jgi:hypothetical protein
MRRTIHDLIETPLPEGWDPAAHRIRWYARTTPCAEYPDGLIPRNRHMDDRYWGWDAECSCGQRTRTGGAIAARIREAAHDHLRHGTDL